MVVATLDACQGCFHYVKITVWAVYVCQTEPSVKLIKINGYLPFAHAVLVLFLCNLSRWKCYMLSVLWKKRWPTILLILNTGPNRILWWWSMGWWRWSNSRSAILWATVISAKAQRPHGGDTSLQTSTVLCHDCGGGLVWGMDWGTKEGGVMGVYCFEFLWSIICDICFKVDHLQRVRQQGWGVGQWVGWKEKHCPLLSWTGNC